MWWKEKREPVIHRGLFPQWQWQSARAAEYEILLQQRAQNRKEAQDRLTNSVAAAALFRKENATMGKKCHACGQKLPLKVGDIVETNTPRAWVGMVTALSALREEKQTAHVVGFDGSQRDYAVRYLTRAHGYYRITEREPLL